VEKKNGHRTKGPTDWGGKGIRLTNKKRKVAQKTIDRTAIRSKGTRRIGRREGKILGELRVNHRTKTKRKKSQTE